MPQAVVSGLLFALFLQVTPTGGWAMILASVVLNVAAVGLAWAFVRGLTGSRQHAASAALLTAVWFLPPAGAYYHDHLSYALVLASGYSILLRPAGTRGALLAGVLLALAYHTKQTVGLVGALSLVGMVALAARTWRERVSTWASITAPYLLVQVLFVGALVTVNALETYATSAVTLPLSYAEFSKASLSRLVNATVLPWGIDPVRALQEGGFGRLAFYPMVLVVYAAYVTLALMAPVQAERRLLAGYTFVLLSTMFSATFISKAFSHRVFALGIVVALTLYWWRRSLPPFTARLIVAGLVVSALVMSAANRIERVRDAWPGGDTDLWPVRVLAGDTSGVEAEALREVYTLLRHRDGTLAVLDDRALVVPLALRRAPVQPWAYFEEWLTVPVDDAAADSVDNWIAARFEQAQVRNVLTTLGSHERSFELRRVASWNYYPDLRTYLEERYDLEYSRGDVSLWRRR